MKYLSYLVISAAGGLAGLWIKPLEVAERPVSDRKPDAVSPTLRKDGAALLDEFIARKASAKMRSSGSKADSTYGQFEELRAVMERSENPERDFRALFAEYDSAKGNPRKGMELLPKLGVMLAQWLEQDGRGALEFLTKSYQENGAARIVANLYLRGLAKEYVSKHGWKAYAEAVSGQESLLSLAAPAIFDDFAAHADRAGVESLKEIAPSLFGNGEAGRLLAERWPVGNREELLGLLDPNSAAEAMATLVGRMEDNQGADWILDKLKNGGVSDELRSAMARGKLGRYYSSVEGATLEQRLAIMDELGTLKEMGADRAKNEMIYASLRNCFDSWENSDTLYALRHGVLSAAEVVELAARETPDPGKHRGEYDSQMYRTLAEENVDAAEELLAGMSEEEKAKQKAYAARWWFRTTNPNEFYQLVSGVDSSSDEGLRSLLQDAWNDKASGNVSRFGSAYLDWIQSLPDGLEKTMALQSIRSAGNPALSKRAAELLDSKP